MIWTNLVVIKVTAECVRKHFLFCSVHSLMAEMLLANMPLREFVVA